MMVDTRATVVCFQIRCASDRAQAVAGRFHRKSATANGVVQVAPVLLREVTGRAEIAVANVQAVVVRKTGLPLSLLGCRFLAGCRISKSKREVAPQR